MRDLVKHTLRQYDMVQSGSVLVAVSGGRDSMALLHVLHSLKTEMDLQLSAVHVNHHLRDASDAEQKLVQEFAHLLEVPLFVADLHVIRDRNSGESIEMAARRLRYEAFVHALGTMAQSAACATAHHQGDQAETVLMHLLRGSGTKGLAGIQPVRPPFIRPMLFVPTERIQMYVDEHKIPYLNDESNGDNRYLRNRIRHCLLPELTEYNPNVQRALAATAMAAQEDDAYLRMLAAEEKRSAEYKSIPNLAVWMRRDKLGALPIVLQKRIVRMALEELGIFHLEEGTLQRSIQIVQCGGTVQLQKDVFIKGGYDLQVYRQMPAEIGTVHLTQNGTCRLGMFNVFAGDGEPSGRNALWSVNLCTESLIEDLSIRTRQSADAIAYDFGHKKLSDAFIEARVPFCLRDHLPVLLLGEEIIWAPGVKAASRFTKQDPGKRRIAVQVERA